MNITVKLLQKKNKKGICNNPEYMLQCTNSLGYKYKFSDISFNITVKKNLWQSSDNLTSDWTNSNAQETDTWTK